MVLSQEDITPLLIKITLKINHLKEDQNHKMNTQKFDKFQPIKYTLNQEKEDLKKILSEKLPLVVPLNSEPLTTILLILMIYVPIISEEEFFYFFVVKSTSTIHRAFDLLRDSGMIDSVYLYGNNKTTLHNSSYTDSRTSKVFLLTRKGYGKVCHYVGQDKKQYKAFKSDKYYMHAYSTGWNILTVLTNPFIPRLLNYESEYKLGLNNVKDIYCDGMIELSGATLYLEQDVGTEKIDELRDKLIRYGLKSYSMDRNHDYVVLTVRRRYVTISPIGRQKGNARYSKKILENVLDYMEYYRSVLNPPSLSSLIDLLSNSPLLDSKSAESDFNDFAILKQELVDNNLEFLDTYGSIRDHLNSFKRYDNNIYNDELNHIQWDYFVKFRNALIDDIRYDGHIGENAQPMNEDMQAFVMFGFHFFCAPTTIMSYYLPYILYPQSFVRKIVEKTLAARYAGFDVNSYKVSHYIVNSSIYRNPDSPIKYSITLPNKYESTEYIFFIENLTLDISTPFRIIAAYKFWTKKMTSAEQKKCIIIALVDSIDDARFFNRMLKLYTIPYKRSFQVAFMVMENPYYKDNNTWLHCSSYGTNSSNDVLFRFKEKEPDTIEYLSVY